MTASANRLERRMASLRTDARRGIAPFVTAGDGGIETTLAVLRALERSGAVCVELGFPFSDPIADGPILQAASQRALAVGTRFDDVLELVARFRELGGELPIAWMSYVNPLLRRGGFSRAVDELAAVGVDALLVPDLPLEEAGELCAAAHARDVAPIFFASPTSSDERLAAAARASRGFFYVVGRIGVTGRATEIDAATREYLTRVRRASGSIPLAVGFGIASGAQVRALAPFAQLAIVGSALVERIHRAGEASPSSRAESAARAASEFLAELKSGLEA